jgi:hypothetical protein
MTRDYYRPVMALRIVNYIDGKGVARHHALQFRREHSEQWLEVPVLSKPYGSDNLIDTDMAGYEYDSEEMQPHHLEEFIPDNDSTESDLKEHINILEQMLEAAAKESSRMQYKVEQLEYEIKGWKGLYRRGAGN